MLAGLREHLPAVLSRIIATLVVALVSSYFLAMGLGLLLFYSTPQGVEASTRQISILPVSMFMVVNFGIPLGVNLGFFFFVLWLLFVAAFVLAWLDGPGFLHSLKGFSLNRLVVRRANYLVTLPQLACILLLAIVLLQALQESAGVQTGGLSFENPVMGFLLVSYAPFVEELSFRITTLGLLTGLYLMWKTRHIPADHPHRSAAALLLRTIWNPEKAKQTEGLATIQANGLRNGISRFEWLVLVITSGAFGAVHYLYGGGWEIGKISTAMLSGLVLGLVYLRYGLYAPILLHWYFNYYFGTFDLASQIGLPGFDLVGLGVQFLNLGFGVLLGVVLIALLLTRVWALRRRVRQNPGESAEEFPNVS